MLMAKTLAPHQIVSIAAALASNKIPQRQIAKIHGVARGTVQRLQKRLAEADNIDQLKATYKMLLLERLPVADRADIVSKVARKGNSNPFAALRALEYADTVQGIAAKQSIDPGSVQQPPALFSLPSGSDISIRIKPTQPVIDVSNTYTDEIKND